MRMIKWFWAGVVVTLIVGITFIYFSEKARYPECFITNEECHNPYNEEPMFYKNDKLIQCCRKPHYMLQGIEELTDYCMDFKKEILDKNITRLSKY